MATEVRINRAQASFTARTFAKNRVRRFLSDAETEAKRIASTGPYSTGRLARSITVFTANVPFGVRGRLGSDLSYADVVNRGAKPHPIFPVRRKVLYFFWRKIAENVFLPQVNHPGMSGKKWLDDALARSAKAHGFRYRINRTGITF